MALDVNQGRTEHPEAYIDATTSHLRIVGLV